MEHSEQDRETCAERHQSEEGGAGRKSLPNCQPQVSARSDAEQWQNVGQLAPWPSPQVSGAGCRGKTVKPASSRHISQHISVRKVSKVIPIN